MAKKKRSKASDRRRFPRKETSVKVKLRARRDKNIVFEAHLASRDVSVGGIFLESDFFVKPGTKLRAEFELEGAPEPIEVSGVVVREERVRGASGNLRSGFAIQFTDYVKDAKLSLATYFLAPQVRGFVADYNRSGRRNRIRGEEEKQVDLIVAWEMYRFDNGLEGIKP